MKINSLVISFLLPFFFISCSEDILDKKPEPTGRQILSSEAIKTKSDLRKLLISNYDVIANMYGGQIQNFGELLGDNLDSPVSQNDYFQIYARNTDIFNGTINRVYSDAYISIYRANQVILQKDVLSDISETEKIQFEAESRFIRALAHHGILRLFAQPAGFTQDNSHLGIVMRMEVSMCELI